MSETTQQIISDEELDILQEIMNIAFGKATADLAQIIDIYINLSVPYVKVINTASLEEYIKEEIRGYNDISIVEQKFWGEFKGSAFLIFPAGAGKELITLLTGEEIDAFASDPIDELEKGTLMEVGNILIGACVGKIAELLNDSLAYSPPIVHIGNTHEETLPKALLDAYDLTIALKTSFSFEKKDIVGFLFVVTSQESLLWLRKALNDFLEQYT
ncbi:MAG: chemotaxis protein CheC [Syntrophus sp. (in: bacteria)]|nr:chemotaxis protein CheC [Syntrophus sp. (in: bacteria)]